MHIILYVLDALRADHLGCYGYERDTSPNIDSLAHEGVVFENCFTSTTWTRPVAASILTGTYPGLHLTGSRYDMFSTNLARLPEVLKAGGFKTGAFSTMGNVSSEVGFGHGFDCYHDLFREPAILAKRRRLNTAKEGLMQSQDSEIALPRAEDIHDFLFPWLAENRQKNCFSFIWSIETHDPYTAPQSFWRFSRPTRANEGELSDIRSSGEADRERLSNLYDNEIYYNDYCIGKIINNLKELNIYDDTLFVIIGDHGDAFYEHGFYTHSHAPYEELIHVPMIFKFPKGDYAGKRITGLVELIDIFPTLMTATGLGGSASGTDFLQGHNLLPLIEGREQKVRDYTFSETRILDVHNRYLSVRSEHWKYIRIERPKRRGNTFRKTLQHVLKRGMMIDILRSPRHFLRTYLGGGNEQLFDLKSDPGEQNNLAKQRPDLLAHYQQLLDEWLQQNEQLAQEVGKLEYSYEESETLRQHLEMLGYL